MGKQDQIVRLDHLLEDKAQLGPIPAHVVEYRHEHCVQSGEISQHTAVVGKLTEERLELGRQVRVYLSQVDEVCSDVELGSELVVKVGDDWLCLVELSCFERF